MKYKTAVFDMDGTVLNTLGDLTYAMNYALRHFGMREVQGEEMKKNLGNGARYLVENTVPEGTSKETVEQFLSFYMSYYESRGAVETAPYEGIVELFETLRQNGITACIVSNKPDGAVQDLSEKFFNGYPAIGERPAVRRKPAPDMVWTMLDELQAQRDTAVYIGDSEVDVETAAAAGLPCIAVTWGFRTRQELIESGATEIVDTVAELCEHLLA